MAAPGPKRDPDAFDRRAERLNLPPCPSCSARDTQVATRTDYVLYLRCPKCFHVWSVPKPTTPSFGSE